MLVVDPCIEKAQQEFFWHCKLWSSGGRNSSLMYLWSEELWSHKHSHKILCQIFIETVSDNLYFPHDRIKVLYLFQLWQKSSNYRCKYLKRHLAPVTLVYRNTNQQLICEQSIEQHCFVFWGEEFRWASIESLQSNIQRWFGRRPFERSTSQQPYLVRLKEESKKEFLCAMKTITSDNALRLSLCWKSSWDQRGLGTELHNTTSWRSFLSLCF